MKISIVVRNCIYIILVGLFISSFFLRSFLPEKMVQDSVKLLKMINENSSGIDSFSRSAQTINFLSFGYVNIFILILGLLYLFLLSRHFVYTKHFFVFLLFLAPNLILNLLIPGKELLVVLISVLVVFCVKYIKNKYLPLLVIIILYLFYGYYIRLYYILILMVFFFIFFLLNLKKTRYKVLLTSFLFFNIALFLPEEIYPMIFAQRDLSNDFAISIGSINRTAFNNLYLPTNFIEAIINYIYISSIIFFPNIYFYSIKEIFLTIINYYIIKYLLMIRTIKTTYKTNILYSLFYSHLFVLIIFEPDLGSYLRHITSCSLYLVAYMYLLKTDFEKNAKKK